MPRRPPDAEPPLDPAAADGDVPVEAGLAAVRRLQVTWGDVLLVAFLIVSAVSAASAARFES